MDRYSILQNSAIVLAVVLVLVTVWAGYNSGLARAQSRVVVENAEAVTVGLEYFYSDYDRFPTTVEYENPTLMGAYFSPWPAAQLTSRACTASSQYENTKFNEYTLLLCVPAAYQSIPKGVSAFTVAK